HPTCPGSAACPIRRRPIPASCSGSAPFATFCPTRRRAWCAIRGTTASAAACASSCAASSCPFSASISRTASMATASSGTSRSARRWTNPYPGTMIRRIYRPAMRFCPFCAQENPDDARECVHCGKRLPALRAARAPAPPPKPAAPSRPVAPRPAPRAPSAALNDPTLKPHEAFAPTAAPGTFPPLKPPAQVPPNRPAKATPHDATLKPVHDAEETRETPSPPHAPPHAPHTATGTLLGLPAQEIPGAMHPASQGDSERRTTRPLGLPHLAKDARRAPVFDEEPATRVHGPAPDPMVDAGPPSLTPKA